MVIVHRQNENEDHRLFSIMGQLNVSHEIGSESQSQNKNAIATQRNIQIFMKQSILDTQTTRSDRPHLLKKCWRN